MPKIIFASGFLSLLMIAGCGVSAESGAAKPEQTVVKKENTKNSQIPAQNKSADSQSKNSIQIAQDSPADTVRTFYGHLRENRFREAMMMTNVRSAVENLTEEEMRDLSKDFAALATQVPADIPINGEIITNNKAVVTTKMIDAEGKTELKEVQLRREGENWTILTTDEKGEAEAKKQGSRYFFNLRLDVHHAETQAMMERIAREETAYAVQNGEKFADLQTLISKGVLPEDINKAETTGYTFKIVPSADGKSYFATAEPVEYGKSGKLSFLLESRGVSEKPRLKYTDNKGKVLKN